MTREVQEIRPCLWFDTKAEDAAKFYVSVFPNSAIKHVSRYGNEGQEIHGKAPGTVMAVEFELNGRSFVALNGGPEFKFDEAISFQIPCGSQEDVDFYWSKLTADGGQEGPCGWCKDKFGLSWQVVPNVLFEMLTDPDSKKADRVTKSFLQMRKFDIAELQRAFEGVGA